MENLIKERIQIHELFKSCRDSSKTASISDKIFRKCIRMDSHKLQIQNLMVNTEMYIDKLVKIIDTTMSDTKELVDELKEVNNNIDNIKSAYKKLEESVTKKETVVKKITDDLNDNTKKIEKYNKVIENKDVEITRLKKELEKFKTKNTKKKYSKIPCPIVKTIVKKIKSGSSKKDVVKEFKLTISSLNKILRGDTYVGCTGINKLRESVSGL